MNVPHWQILRFCCSLFAVVCFIAPAYGQTVLEDAGGGSHSGTIEGLFLGTVTLKTAAGEQVELALESLTAASKEAVHAWAAQHPHAVDVYTVFDEPPAPTRTNNPRNFLDRSVRTESGMVGVEVVIDETGAVIYCEVVRSSNDKLNEASLKAVQEWRFTPAKVGGNTVRARLRIPMRY